ncbi:uncharacterized protein LOC109707713 isoform X3 [Ananas comosus]|uniref:Uncharacterized protein LOC109707713 isoform X3 n=1 Tax=Ananas comosus TaxID=4615 RepID=A0A6P5EMG3_ANACO|nr:uncharacterized protein LOC109707713 isoform X3 [Ananas comosus]
MGTPFLLERYRRDRRNLLEFLFSEGLIRAPSRTSIDLAGLDLDSISADYVLDCLESGEEFDPSEATRRYFDGLKYPIMLNSSSTNSYYFVSEPEISGSPPRRAAPRLSSGMKITTNGTSSQVAKHDNLIGRDVGISGESRTKGVATADEPSRLLEDKDILSLGLPGLSTGISDDEIRETAYEVLLACLFCGGKVHFPEEMKKEKKTNFLKGLRSKREGLSSFPVPEDSHSDFLDIIRVQMEISEATNAFIRKGSRLSNLREMNEQIDVPCISLNLISVLYKLDFPSERLRMQWQRRQANILEELLGSVNMDSKMRETLQILLRKLRSIEEKVSDVYDGFFEILSLIKRYASKLSSMPGKYGFQSKAYYRTASYQFNIKLYEKLLYSVFDILEDGKILEEADEMLEVYEFTWSTLGITQKLHNVLYAWVLFQQFIKTGEFLLLKLAVLEMQKVLSHKNDEGTEEAYISSLICSVESYGSKRFLCLVDAIFFKIYLWCCYQLEDYHLHFAQEKSAIFGSVVNLAVLTQTTSADECAENKYFGSMAGNIPEWKLFHFFIVKSIQAAFKRACSLAENQSSVELKHPLAIVAHELKQVAEKEYTAFYPVLCQKYPKSGKLAFILLHLLYGERLKPFLEGLTHLSESVKEVLAASNTLELCLAHKLSSIYGDNVDSSATKYVHPYQISHYCAPLVLQWIHAQHDNILEWTKRAVEIEDWEPLSSQQRQAKSAVEVFRIVEETVDQFFSSNLPMDIIHLRSLLIGIVRSLEAYLLHIVNQQVDVTMLYPSTPALTRYAESIYPFMKKKFVQLTTLEEKMTFQLNTLTGPKLCVKLNTLHYIRDQLDTLEDTIKHSWNLVQSGFGLADYFSRISNGKSSVDVNVNLSACNGSVDELFALFDNVRRGAVTTSKMMLDFIGPRVIFWDMRDSFLFSLYRSSVNSARLEIFIPLLDQVLDRICDLIIDELRDQVVLKIFQASMDGFIWVLLDGGPSRAFSEADVPLMQEDLAMLKELFIANGQGLPFDVVEKEARLARQILDLFALKADTIIEMLVSASEQTAYHLKPTTGGRSCANDAQTLLRVLCHKKDGSASEFLKMHYQLPKSSDYDDIPSKEERTSTSPILSDIFRGAASGRRHPCDVGAAGRRRPTHPPPVPTFLSNSHCRQSQSPCA